jgi:gamma-carbonic anhydrase
MIIAYKDKTPAMGAGVFVESSARVIGDVEIGAGSSVWFNTVIRGDVNYIRIGARTNIQDCSVVHVTLNKWPTVIGNDVTVGHRAVVHGATIGDHCLIGMGAVVLDGAELSEFVLVGAGALVPPGMKVPPRSLVVGVPGKVVRELKDSDIDMLIHQSQEYERLAKEYWAGF